MTSKTLSNRLAAVAVAATLSVSATAAFSQASDWSTRVFKLVTSRQTYPRAAEMRGDEGTAKVRVYVNPVGSIQKVELVAPSGSSLLDREAVALPTKIGKFPAPPAGTNKIILSLTWKLF